MGVTGFWDYMQKYASKIDPSELQDKVLTIDGHSWLFDSTSYRGQQNVKNSFLLTFYRRCLTLRQHNIEPIVVFDKIPMSFDELLSEPGVRMLQKKRTKRGGCIGWNSNVLHDLNTRVNLVKELLNSMGIRVVEGGADGDAQCAQLEEIGASNGCITCDLDYFLFGGKHIYKIDFIQGGANISSVQHLSMDKLEEMTLNRNRLIALAMMLGCDYVERGIERVGMISALEILSEFALHEDDHPISILDRFASYYRQELPLRKDIDSERKVKIRSSNFNLPDGFPNTDVYIEASCLFLQPRVEKIDKASVDSPGTLNFKAISSLLQRECGWTAKRMDIVMKRRSPLTKSHPRQSIVTSFFSSTRRRSLPVVENCSHEDRLKCSQREWAALEKLRHNAALYNAEDTSKSESPTSSSSGTRDSVPPKKRARKTIIEISSSTTCTQQQGLKEEIDSMSDTSMSKPVLALTGPGGNSQLADEQILVDALPYLDTDYNEADRQMALKLVEQECKVFRPTKNYLKHLPVPDYDAFLSPCIMKEFARINKKQEMPKLDMSRCELPCPAGTPRAGDKQQWRQAIKNAKTQNEHLVMRQINLELMLEYGSEAFLEKNKELEAVLTDAEIELRKIREETMGVHAHRKMAQMDAGRQLKELERNWVTMVTNNYRMELANNQLEEANATNVKRLRLDPASLEPKI